MESGLASTDVDALRLAGALLRLVRVLDQDVRSSRSEDGLNLAELSVLQAVMHGSDLPTLIAKALRLDPARVTHVTDRLVGLGYLQREADVEDRRKLRIRLTESGAERVAIGRADIEAAMQQLLDKLTPAELDGLNRALEGVRRVLSPNPAAQ